MSISHLNPFPVQKLVPQPELDMQMTNKTLTVIMLPTEKIQKDMMLTGSWELYLLQPSSTWPMKRPTLPIETNTTNMIQHTSHPKKMSAHSSMRSWVLEMPCRTFDKAGNAGIRKNLQFLLELKNRGGQSTNSYALSSHSGTFSCYISDFSFRSMQDQHLVNLKMPFFRVDFFTPRDPSWATAKEQQIYPKVSGHENLKW